MKDMDKSYKVLIIMLVVAGILFGINTFFNKDDVKDYTLEDYIDLGNDKISSIYYVIGEKKIDSTKTGFDNRGDYIEITYKNLSLVEITNYLVELRAHDYVLINSDKHNATIANDSVDDGKVITIEINYLNNKTKIKYSKGNGSLNKD